MNGKAPNKAEQLWIDKITSLGCIVCLLHHHIHSPAEVHHINGGDKHLETIPLCTLHHRAGVCNDEYVSRHPYKTAFEGRYGPEAELLLVTRRTLGEHV